VSAAGTLSTLDRYGPDADGPAPSRDEAWAHVHRLAGGHYENFSVLSRLVPTRLRDDFAAVYAFCRWADDLGDETGAGDDARARSRDLLAWWRRGLHACDAHARGDADAPPPRHPVYIALAETIARRDLSRAHFDDLIGAFEQDQDVRVYGSWDQLVAYCARSANPVGRLVLELAGYRAPDHPELFAMADATCSALQLTNFWQDVRRDLLERDRVYLPREETGLTPERLRRWIQMPEEPMARIAFIKAVRPLVHRTRDLFAAGRPLPARLDNEMAPVVWLFGAGGERVLTAVERVGCATLWRRPRLGRARKASLLAAAALRFRAARARRAPAA
jgi:squalene synthase HpnC